MNTRYFSILIVALVVGVMLAIQFKTTLYIEQGVPSDRFQQLVVEQRQLEKDIVKLEAEIADLTSKLEQSDKGHTQVLNALQDELNKARLAAGIVTVTGSGIEITLDNPSPDKANGSLFNVRDEDLLRMVNELRGAGAEAISINGNRIIASSEIRLAGSFINVNLNRTVPPYHVLAVGNPEKLRSAMEITGGLAEYLRDLGIQLRISPHDRMTVPGYVGKLKYNYIKID